MKKTKYYIKYRNMYLNYLYTDSGYAQNNFIEEINFRMYEPNYSYTYENAISIIDKLVDLGYVLDNFNLEEVENED